ncbi:MAG: DsrE/DsrF/DrsH-like family protein [Rhodospirillales bacterium]|nr:DsrE/DsrF/DrsH-like family protein [Rhodospirillales bacterium]
MPWQRRPPVRADPPALGILLLDGGQERAHYAFVMAAGAAALGRSVVVFATNRGCRALLADPSGLEGWSREAVLAARGVAGLEELRAAAVEFGVRLIACEAGLRAEALDDAPLLAGVEVAGVATFLAAIGGGQIVSL